MFVICDMIHRRVVLYLIFICFLNASIARDSAQSLWIQTPIIINTRNLFLFALLRHLHLDLESIRIPFNVR